MTGKTSSDKHPAGIEAPAVTGASDTFQAAYKVGGKHVILCAPPDDAAHEAMFPLGSLVHLLAEQNKLGDAGWAELSRDIKDATKAGSLIVRRASTGIPCAVDETKRPMVRASDVSAWLQDKGSILHWRGVPRMASETRSARYPLEMDAVRAFVPVRAIRNLVWRAVEATAAHAQGTARQELLDAAMPFGFNHADESVVAQTVLEWRKAGRLRVFHEAGLGELQSDDVLRGWLTRSDFSDLLAQVWNVEVVPAPPGAMSVARGESLLTLKHIRAIASAEAERIWPALQPSADGWKVQECRRVIGTSWLENSLTQYVLTEQLTAFLADGSEVQPPFLPRTRPDPSWLLDEHRARVLLACQGVRLDTSICEEQPGRSFSDITPAFFGAEVDAQARLLADGYYTVTQAARWLADRYQRPCLDLLRDIEKSHADGRLKEVWRMTTLAQKSKGEPLQASLDLVKAPSVNAMLDSWGWPPAERFDPPRPFDDANNGRTQDTQHRLSDADCPATRNASDGTASEATNAATPRNGAALSPTLKRIRRQDERLDLCEQSGLVFTGSARLPDGVGAVALTMGISRQALSEDLRAALARRADSLRSGAPR